MKNLEKALLMAFDPFTNEEIQKVIGKEMDLRELHDYYKVPVMCLLRIKESVDTWEKPSGFKWLFRIYRTVYGCRDKRKGNELFCAGKKSKNAVIILNF